MPSILAERIEKRMAILGFKKLELAQAAHALIPPASGVKRVDERYIGKYLAQTSIPSLPILQILAQALQTSVGYLLGETDDPHPPKRRHLITRAA